MQFIERPFLHAHVEKNSSAISSFHDGLRLLWRGTHTDSQCVSKSLGQKHEYGVAIVDINKTYFSLRDTAVSARGLDGRPRRGMGGSAKNWRTYADCRSPVHICATAFSFWMYSSDDMGNDLCPRCPM